MSWDEYYLSICKAVGANSKCLSRHIGAILVKDKSIISTGYNGPPRGVPSCNERYLIDNFLRTSIKIKGINLEDESIYKKCPRSILGFKSGEGLEFCIAGHSERNCLLNAARHGICTLNTTLYMDWKIPCKDCLIELINAGVKEVVCTDKMFYDEMSQFLVEQSNLIIREFRSEEK